MAQAATLDTRAAKNDRLAGPAAVLAWAQHRGQVMAATVNQVATAANWVAVTGHPDTALLPAAGGPDSGTSRGGGRGPGPVRELDGGEPDRGHRPAAR
jgi:hypothetical protein